MFIVKGNLQSRKKLSSNERAWKIQKTSHHRPQCAKWFLTYSISKSGIWAKWTSPFCRFKPHFQLNMVSQMQYCNTMKKLRCNISEIFCLICLKLCTLLELGKEILLHFKFCCYGNQNQNYCLILKKQKVYCLSKSDVWKVEDKWVIHSSYCE